jgi:hypothetical protein
MEITPPTDPAWPFEALKIAAPVTLGALVWAGQTLAQKAWTEYERRRDAYIEVVQLIDSLFVGGQISDRQTYLRSIRKVWLIGSDQVIIAANNFSRSIKDRDPEKQQKAKYSLFISAMRQDLRKRRWLPPTDTRLRTSRSKILERSGT